MSTDKISDAPRAASIEEIRRIGLQRIKETDVAGPGTGHMREDNLFAIQRFIDGDPTVPGTSRTRATTSSTRCWR